MHCERSATILQKSFHLNTFDGLPLLVRQTAPAGSLPRRTLVIVHGAGEHSQRYEHWARLLAQHHWRVISLDHRGYGRSGGLPGYVDRFDQYLADLDLVRETLQLPPETVFFGHSLGGLIATRYAQTRPGALAGLVLSCPLLGLQLRIPAWKRTLGRICTLFAPRTRFQTTIRSEQLTRDPAARRTREADPLRCRSVTANWYFQMLDAIVEAWSDQKQVQIPLLLLQGEKDEVVDPEAAIRWWVGITSEDKTLRFLAGHLHELLNEPDWNHTASGIVAWLEQRVPEPTGLSIAPWIDCRSPGLPRLRAA